MTTALAAERLIRTRQGSIAKLERENAALSQWNEYRANQTLPPGLMRYIPRPEVSRETLADLHTMLVQELGRVEGSE